MSSKLSVIKNLAMVGIVVLATAWIAYAQNAEQLVDQLRGKAQAPSRSAEQLAQAYQEAINYLLPLISAEDVASRYEPQIALQDMGSHAARLGAEAEREALARVLCKSVETAEMQATVRYWFVLQIERIGKDESVQTLTKLLSSQDKELRDYARRALEKNPSSAATQSLERAVKEAKDSAWKAALAHSLAERSQTDTTGGPVTASAKDVAAMTSALKKGAGPEQVSSAQRLVSVAGGLVKQQKFDQAMSIYADLNNWATEQEKRGGQGQDAFFIRAAALNGMATCDGQRAAEVVVTAMRSENRKVRSVAVKAARNAATKDATRALTEMLAELDPYFQKQVLGLIADRGDLSSVKSVKAVLNSQDESVKLAAIEALARVGGDEAAESLLEIAASGQGAVAKAARDGLAVMVGPRVDDVIKTAAASGDANGRVVAISLLGQRQTAGAAESLLGYAGDADGNISAAAFKALAAVAGAGDMATLADLLAKTKDNQARQNAVATLKSVLAKCSDKDAAAKIVIKQMEASDSQARLSLLTTLSALGGPTALKAVTEAAQSSDEASREAGIRTLGDWPDYEAAQVLLDIASKPETSLTHHVLAITGAVRLIKAATSAPLSDRADLCFSAFDYARRDEEKKLVISAMGSVPEKKVAGRLLELVRNDALKIEAGLAAVELAGNMARTDRQAALELAQKIRELNLSDEINRRADDVAKGRRRR